MPHLRQRWLLRAGGRGSVRLRAQRLRKAGRPRRGGDARARQHARPVRIGHPEPVDALGVRLPRSGALASSPETAVSALVLRTRDPRQTRPCVRAHKLAGAFVSRQLRPLHVGPVSTARAEDAFGIQHTCNSTASQTAASSSRHRYTPNYRTLRIPDIGSTDPQHNAERVLACRALRGSGGAAGRHSRCAREPQLALDRYLATQITRVDPAVSDRSRGRRRGTALKHHLSTTKSAQSLHARRLDTNAHVVFRCRSRRHENSEHNARRTSS